MVLDKVERDRQMYLDLRIDLLDVRLWLVSMQEIWDHRKQNRMTSLGNGLALTPRF